MQAGRQIDRQRKETDKQTDRKSIHRQTERPFADMFVCEEDRCAVCIVVCKEDSCAVWEGPLCSVCAACIFTDRKFGHLTLFRNFLQR